MSGKSKKCIDEGDNKRFEEWIELKENLHAIGATHNIRDGEVWWCAMGENVGVEINGKNATFSRPVLVFKVLSRWGFMGIPLTSQLHEGSWYAQFVFKDKIQVAALSQIRMFSTARLYNRMGQIPEKDYEIISAALKALLF